MFATPRKGVVLDLLALIQAFEISLCFAYIGWIDFLSHDLEELRNYPFFVALNGTLDRQWWLVLFTAMLVITLVGIVTGSIGFRRTTLALGVIVWCAVSFVLITLPVASPSKLQAVGVAVGCWWANVRIGPAMDARRKRILDEQARRAIQR